MKRRAFIGITAAGAAGMAVTSAARAGAVEPRVILAMPEVVHVLGDRRVAEIGELYRTTVPSEQTAEALEQAIRADVEPGPDTSLGARVRERVRRDFALGRTITLGGWILSVTEARQCALYSLLAA
jgi:hypothetical protein